MRMFFDILKRDLKRKKTMNIIILLFVILSVMFVSSSVTNLTAVTGSLDSFFDKAGVGDYIALERSGGSVTVKDAVKKAAPKDAKKETRIINAENAGFKAGDVYQALATAEKALTVAEIAKKAGINEQEVILGAGWLLKEGKIKDCEGKIVLA